MGRALQLSPAVEHHLLGCHEQYAHDDHLDVEGAHGRKSCELCREVACVFCPADEAHLCLACDRAVHSANFLVSRHNRKVLCRSCGAPCNSSASGYGIDDYGGRWHCSPCSLRPRREEGRRTETLSATSSESGNSSCCTESRSSDHGEVAVAVAPRLQGKKRLPVLDLLNVEEGYGDSDDPRHSSSSSSKSPCFCLSGTRSHARPLYTAAPSHAT